MPPELPEPDRDPGPRPLRPAEGPRAVEPTQPLRGARRILLCLRWGIGDLVMELPLLEALRREVPRADITALGARPAIELLEHEASVDRLAALQKFGFTHWGSAGSRAGRVSIARWCRSEEFDCILDGSHAPRGARLALQGLGLPWLDTGDQPVSADDAGGGQSLLTRAAESSWGFPIEQLPPRLTLKPEEQTPAARIRRELSGSAPLVALAPIASSRLKRAAASEFARAADALVETHDCRVLLFGGHENQDSNRVIAHMHHKSRAHMVEPVHLRFTAALLQQCEVMVCNDTGLMHLGAAVGTPVVGVFACTSPQLYLPPGGIGVQRWTLPCRYPEAEQGRFGVTPCVAANRCLDRNHERVEEWADAAVAAASAALDVATGSEQRR